MSCELMAGLPQSIPHPSFHYIFPLSLGKSSDSAIFQIPHSLKGYKCISTTIHVIALLSWHISTCALLFACPLYSK